MKSRVVLTIISLLVLSIFCSASEEVSSKEEILNHEEWKNIYLNYSLENGMISMLKEKIYKVDSVLVYFGFWCGDSRHNVPEFIKIFDLINNKKIKITYISVSRKASEKKYFSANFKIERVPTFILLKDGKEIGRIVENPVKSLPEDLLNIIF